MQLKGLSASTQEGYLNAVRRLAEHYHRSPYCRVGNLILIQRIFPWRKRSP